MKNFIGSILLVLIFGVCLGATEKPDWKSWPQYRELKGTVSNPDNFASVVLDDGFWFNGNIGLNSLRLSSGNGDEVPYFTRVERKGDSTQELTASLLDNKVLIGDKTVALVDLGKTRFSNRLTLDSPNEDFNRKVVIEGSLDRKTWSAILSDGFIFDVSNTRNPARKAYLSYPGKNARYLRVSIPLSGQKDAFIINKITVTAYSPETGYVEERYFSGQPQTSANGETVWILDRDHIGLPLHEIAFDFESRNFCRPVKVELSDDQKTWSFFSTCGFFYDAQTGNTENQWKVSGAEGSGRYVRITVTDGNDHPLVVKKITVRRWRRTLLFQPNAPGPYKLYYGNTQAKAPVYDIASWSAKTKHEEVPWTMGEQKNNPDYIPPFVPWTARPVFIWSVLALIIGILGWTLWGSFKKLTASTRR